MNATIIVYESNTGFTARYAAMLSGKLGIPAHPLAEALQVFSAGTKVIHMGWLMASSVAGYKKAARHFIIEAVVGVGLADTGTQDEAVRKACRIPADTPVFTVQGGMDAARLQTPYRLAIRMLTKAMASKKNPTPDEARMTALLQKGGDYVSERELTAVLAWTAQ